ncbi:hypothetical protein [Flavobacterium polysaccharolyticum]|uniref:Uncharacterized protein n=1 Tax=Flavobacterium polysaccharolyticum TaxID=3133148 RepID=A0ABU9NTU5_9FLAO
MLNFLKTKIVPNIFCIIILMSAFIYMYLTSKESEEALKNVVYARVKIKSVELGNKGGPLFLFDYHLNDSVYQGNYTIIDGEELSKTKRLREFKGDYFYIKVSKEKPQYHQLLINYCVRDTTLIQPKSGWKELPEKILSKYINQNKESFF